MGSSPAIEALRPSRTRLDGCGRFRVALGFRAAFEFPAASRFFVVGWALTVVFTLSGCFVAPPRSTPEGAVERLRSADPSELDSAVVVVNGRPISQREFYQRLMELTGASTVREDIVRDELVRQRAEEAGVDVSGDELEHAVQQYFAGMAMQAGGEDKLLEEFERQGLSLAQLRRDAEPKLRSQILMKKLTRADRRVDDSVLRSYYEATYKKRRVMVRHIAYSYVPNEGQTEEDVSRLRVEALDKAKRTLDRVRSGADFSEIAKIESDDAITASRGGLIFDQGVSDDLPMPAVFKEAIFGLGAGQVSDPVESPDKPAVYLFHVDEILSSESFVDCKEKMLRELEEREPSVEEVTQWLAGLRRMAAVEWKN